MLNYVCISPDFSICLYVGKVQEEESNKKFAVCLIFHAMQMHNAREITCHQVERL